MDFTADSGAACGEAQSQAAAALSGNQGCGPDAGCTLLQTPSCVTGPELDPTNAISNDTAVATGALSTVEHAFAVIDAELCPVCGNVDGDDVDFGGQFPIAVCNPQGTCAVAAGSPPSQGQGSFEWDCDAGCNSDQYCEVALPDTQIPCRGWPGFVTVIGPGACLTTAPGPIGIGCNLGSDEICGFFESCQLQIDAGVCELGCVSFQPANCLPNCQLQSDNHGCNVCYCPACPPPPDGG
jgi:hypothetical protein